ncbi:hypothetical protein KHQ06_08085 [Nocardia tengchongensis]|uniref:Uncharacterized protein n=1 Tax=Nocardia tengchongensis TaxID=2055889 RepID=A0ABX8CSN8_9NOCA|nr:hypothetical protein [Nocardia tengchongensis]QVI22911.1 hypothetical protein KHQ06_08085 [Nocardia tengchongensis]
MLRAGAGGSLTVLAALAVAVWGQRAVVAVPLAAYGFAWIAYLWWNAALRPPLTQAVIAVTTAAARGLAALARVVARPFSATAARLDLARTRHETSRTTTA